jgi:hypothetical protein
LNAKQYLTAYQLVDKLQLIRVSNPDRYGIRWLWEIGAGLRRDIRRKSTQIPALKRLMSKLM